MRILFFDLETTGLDINTCEITELAYAIYDAPKKRIVEAHSTLVRVDGEIPEVVTALTGITKEMLDENGIPVLSAMHLFSTACDRDISFVCGHNAAGYDYPILKRIGGYFDIYAKSLNLPIIDTRVDLPFKDEKNCNKLTHLLSDMGYANPFPHSAMADVYSCIKLFSLFDYQEVVNYASEPTLTVQAIVNYDNREKASSKGFRWDGGTKRWLKKIKFSRFGAEAVGWNFQYEVLEGQ